MNEKQASVAARIAELACLPMSELWTVWDRYFPRRPDYPNRTHVESRTGERIRDKIAAAKRKGMWMGGVPPLGYDVDNRLLVINEAEAAVVRRIFEEMLTIGSPTQIAVNLTADGITTKAWTTQEGQIRRGTRIDKKYLHKLLRNRIYLGELSHKGNWYPSVPNELMRLTLLAPDILELLMAGRQPRRMNLIWFQRNPLPADWEAQRQIVKRFEEDA